MVATNTAYAQHNQDYGQAGMSAIKNVNSNVGANFKANTSAANDASYNTARSQTDINNLRSQRANTIGENRAGSDTGGSHYKGPKKVSESFIRAAKSRSLYAVFNWADAKGMPVHMFGVYFKNLYAFLNDPYSDSVEFSKS